jgi:ParB family chromosome partitioning protein
VPIIVRPAEDFTYEILSGHNRTETAKAAGLDGIPAIVREGLTDNEARLIAAVTNLLQRSFIEMSYSERAFALSEYYGAVKNQGRRTDLIRETESMLNASAGNDSETFGTVCQKTDSRRQIADQYDLSGRNVANYLRVNELIDALKDRLDNKEIAFRAAVTLSYLSTDEQRAVEDILDSSHYKLDMKKAEALRVSSRKRTLDSETAERILAGTKKPRPAKPAGFRLKPKIVSRYFMPEQKPDEIEAIIIEALEFFYAHGNRESEVIPHGENIPANDGAGTSRPPEIPVGQRGKTRTEQQSGVA